MFPLAQDGNWIAYEHATAGNRTFTYDIKGNKLTKTNGGVKTTYVYNTDVIRVRKTTGVAGNGFLAEFHRNIEGKTSNIVA
ncbi:MAG: hypothetical protein K6T99_12280 [Armatimonadetes bacterium]|nr:hypothetical protein [Armatimonadota bacterium]